MEKGSQEEDESNIILRCPPASNQQYPWLILFDGDDYDRHTFYTITDDKYYVRYVPLMRNKYISSYCHGYLFMQDYENDESYLFNLATMETLQLPSLSLDGFYACVLSSPPVDNSCRVLAFEGNTTVVQSCYLGDNAFVEIDLAMVHPIMAATTFQGKLFTVTFYDFNLWSASYDDPHLHMTAVFTGDALRELLIDSFEKRFYLVESCGELLLIYDARYDSFDGPYIQAFKADFDNKKWVMLKTLGDRAIFLDEKKALVSPLASKFGLKENCVYYVNSYDRNLYTYDFEDQSVTVSLPSPNVYSTNVSPFWAM